MSLNTVQIAFDKLTVERDLFAKTEINSVKDMDKWGLSLMLLSRLVYLEVYKLTKENNPSLNAEILKGSYDNFYLFSSNICYLDSNWQVMKGAKCSHCGGVHNEY